MKIPLVELGQILLVGDFNIRMDIIHNCGTIIFSDFLESVDLLNLVQFTKHKLEHHLDLVFQQRSSNILQSAYHGHVISDHLSVHCNLNIQKVLSKHRVVSYRRLKAIDMIKFSKDMETSFGEEGWDEWDCIQDTTDHYNSILGSVLNRHASMKSKLV